MKASDLSSNAMSVLEYLSDGKARSAKEIAEALTMKRTTLRNALQRMELFGLIFMIENPHRQFAYQVMSEGQALIKRHRLEQKKQVAGITTIPQTKPQVQSIIQEQMKQQPNIVEWLRSMAVAFNNMADEMAG